VVGDVSSLVLGRERVGKTGREGRGFEIGRAMEVCRGGGRCRGDDERVGAACGGPEACTGRWKGDIDMFASRNSDVGVGGTRRIGILYDAMVETVAAVLGRMMDGWKGLKNASAGGGKGRGAGGFEWCFVLRRGGTGRKPPPAVCTRRGEEEGEPVLLDGSPVLGREELFRRALRRGGGKTSAGRSWREGERWKCLFP
jgi:hypothetical protein